MDCLQSSIARVDALGASLSAQPLSAELGLIDTLHATLSYVCNVVNVTHVDFRVRGGGVLRVKGGGKFKVKR